MGAAHAAGNHEVASASEPPVATKSAGHRLSRTDLNKARRDHHSESSTLRSYPYVTFLRPSAGYKHSPPFSLARKEAVYFCAYTCIRSPSSPPPPPPPAPPPFSVSEQGKEGLCGAAGHTARSDYILTIYACRARAYAVQCLSRSASSLLRSALAACFVRLVSSKVCQRFVPTEVSAIKCPLCFVCLGRDYYVQ